MIGIGDFDGKSRNTREVCTREGQRFYRGEKYALEKATGYLVATTGERRRLHVVMYEQEVLGGERIPDGCVIHHLDWDKTHNTVDNLICVTISEHEAIHNTVGGEKGKALGYELLKNRVNGLPPDISNDII